MARLTLADWSDVAGIAGAALGLAGLVFVILQVRSAAAASRAQATIQFQQAFHQSRDARGRLLATFPVSAETAEALFGQSNPAQVRVWQSLDQLTADDKANATGVINALNDVAQYVTDGLPLRSALQQYHSIFIRLGVLLLPYIDALNTAYSDAAGQKRRPTRYGRRLVPLYNAALAYHRYHPKHRHTEIILERPSSAPVHTKIRIPLLKSGSDHRLTNHPGFSDDRIAPGSLVEGSWETEVRRWERRLRR